MAPSFLVTCATGAQGGATVRELLKRGATVHAFVRNPDSDAAKALQEQGAVLFQGTFDDLDSLGAAVAGTTGVFLNAPTDYSDPSVEVRAAEAVIAAARASGTVTTIVASTALKADRHLEWVAKDPNYPLGGYFGSNLKVETAVRGAGFQHHTILRPAWLMHNFLPPTAAFIFPEMASQRRLGFAAEPTTIMPYLSSNDVGRYAAAALLEPARFDGHVVERGLSGCTIEQLVRTLSKASGLPVEAQYYSPDEAWSRKEAFPSLALDRHAAEANMDVDQTALKQYGIPLTSLEDFLAENKVMLLQALEETK